MKSYIAKAQEVERKWYIVDAAGKPLGRVASQVASILRGKNKPTFTPNVDCGDYVIVINAEQVVLTGKKLDQKLMRKHSLYPGGLKETPYRVVLDKKPEFAFEEAVRRMLPKGVLGSHILTTDPNRDLNNKFRDYSLIPSPSTKFSIILYFSYKYRTRLPNHFHILTSDNNRDLYNKFHDFILILSPNTKFSII